MNIFRFLLFLLFITLLSCNRESQTVVVIGDGTGAITAAIQSARSGAKTVLLHEIPWLGGMLTSAGVSAIDGNHQLPSGMWGEFRDSLYGHYGGPQAVATGWVSNTHFEPYIGNRILQNMAKKETNLELVQIDQVISISRKNDLWKIIYSVDNKEQDILAKILIDGTDLGDIAAAAGAKYDVGMESAEEADELIGYKKNDVIQDLTYVAILEEARPGQKKFVIPSPQYDPSIFFCSCDSLCQESGIKVHPCDKMMSYAKLPNNKYLINWPLRGNDIYLNIIEDDQKTRKEKLKLAKQKTLDFVYFIQNELGYDNLVLSESEYPTDDHLPYLPYHREGRRIDGLVRFSSKHIKYPYENDLYKTGIAVGNYPIDHHHKERKDIPELDFPAVPAFTVPMGVMLPKNLPNFILADKAISVSNIANGSTRLQPVIMQIGQVAGIMAAMSIQDNTQVPDLNIRDIQNTMLEEGGYISPFKDIPKSHTGFLASQKIAACGMIELEKKPYKWANEMLFHPDSSMTLGEVNKYANQYLGINETDYLNQEKLTLLGMKNVLSKQFDKEVSINDMKDFLSNSIEINVTEDSPLSRIVYAMILDEYINPFELKDIDINGNWVQ